MANKKDINRYTLTLISSNKYIPLADSTLENFERLSTNFKNKEELISLIHDIFNIDFNIDDIIITYHAYEKTRSIRLLYKNHRALITDKKLVDKIATYLNHIDNVKRLDLIDLHNSFLCDKIKTLLSRTSTHEYNNDLNHIHGYLSNNYKLKRDFSLFLDESLKKKGKNLLSTSEEEKINKEEILDCFRLMKIRKPFSYYFSREYEEFEQEQMHVEGDDFLNSLIARKDIDTISKHYDIDDLYSLGVTNILDGAHELDEEKGKSK